MLTKSSHIWKYSDIGLLSDTETHCLQSADAPLGALRATA
ncbi:hypothetical protein DSUL_20198 [Desulfovibrionales bacterium]